MRFAAMCKTEFICTRENFNIDLQPATCNLQLAVYRDMQYAIRNSPFTDLIFELSLFAVSSSELELLLVLASICQYLELMILYK